MSLASDQNISPDGWSATSRRMLELRDAVFAEWEKRVRASLDKATGLSRPILVDTLPAFYDNIAEALTLDYPRQFGNEGTTLASEHGGERARITAYDYEALIGEYQAFRWAIFDVLYQEGLQLTPQEVLTINASIDQGIQEAVTSFALVHSALRERFAAALTHDLRTPLGATSTALELILMLNDLAKVKGVAAKALDNVHRMDAMIHELLDTMAFHSGGQLSLELSNFDICEVVKEVQFDHAGMVGKRIRFAGAFICGWWDRTAMRRALDNLVKNALKYGHEHEPVTIRTTEYHDRLTLSVHNEGPAIPAHEQECIFQMYRRARSAASTRQQGWGIGLPYVRAVAESHGGSIGLDSTDERGTTFTIDVPVDCRPYLGAPSVA